MEKRMSKSKIKSRKAKSLDDMDSQEDYYYHYHVEDPGSAEPRGEIRKSSREGPGAREVHHHYYYEAPRYRKQRSSKPSIAGGLLIIAGILALIGSMFMIGGSAFIGNMDEGMEFWGAGDTGDLSGQITYLNGTPAENVTISIVGEDLSTQTDNEGNYVIYNVPTGNQEIKVEKEGYNTIIYKTYIEPSDSNWESNDKNGRRFDTGNTEDFTISTGDQVLERGSYPPFGMIGGFMIICGIVILIFAIITLVGGYYAIKRQRFSLAIAGAILGIFTVVGTLFAIIALFILIISRDEFRAHEHESEEMIR
ncbi:carboxypeptidase-like regulatory domain-containing protein [[Eubacterium] cellulosolvens]